MKLAQSVKFGAWFLIAINLIMAFGSIWIFMRMAPAIEVIIAQNEVSLEACENMLTSLLRSNIAGDGSREEFRLALAKAKNNITEAEEPAAIERIVANYEAAFQGDGASLASTVSAINDLGAINREAMRRADARARQLGYAGAWGVVFMSTGAFLVGMIFLRSLSRNLLEPLQEIDTVIGEFRRGESMRRCTMKNPPGAIREIFRNINELLDVKCATVARPEERR